MSQAEQGLHLVEVSSPHRVFHLHNSPLLRANHPQDPKDHLGVGWIPPWRHLKHLFVGSNQGRSDVMETEGMRLMSPFWVQQVMSLSWADTCWCPVSPEVM